MTVSDVDVFLGQRVANGANPARGIQESKSRHSRRGDPANPNAVDIRVTGRWRDHDHVVAGGRECGAEVLQVKLDPADARMIPVADECDLHVAIDTESRPRSETRWLTR